ncbi:MAG: hypothetical protein AA908_06955 [Chlorobi bacterium NICIL-2]|nr:MAG: hypothetical protein AA908_06955 [Chlorobi bacterium NICIL-2]
MVLSASAAAAARAKRSTLFIEAPRIGGTSRRGRVLCSLHWAAQQAPESARTTEETCRVREWNVPQER